jgi:hypothetical protein
MRIDEEDNRKPLFSISYSKPTKRHVAKIIKEQKREEYLHCITRKVIKRADKRQKISTKKRAKRQLQLKVAPNSEESREQIIDNSTKYKRLKL